MRVVLAIAATALVVVSSTTAATQASQASKLRKSEQVVRFFTGQKHGWMIARNQDACRTIPWARTCRIARERLSFHRGRAEKLNRWLWLHLPEPGDWMHAVRVAQRVYPGTASWLASCSASEGGHGGWVPNNQGSGVGGWMQMYPSTFWRMYGAMLPDARGRGFVVPRGTASWYSPLGQALASAWGLTNGRRHEWHGAGC